MDIGCLQGLLLSNTHPPTLAQTSTQYGNISSMEETILTKGGGGLKKINDQSKQITVLLLTNVLNAVISYLTDSETENTPF